MREQIEIIKEAPYGAVGERFFVDEVIDTGVYTVPTDLNPIGLFFYHREYRIVNQYTTYHYPQPVDAGDNQGQSYSHHKRYAV